MCGIVGYAGHKQAAPILLDGLAKLEYRGYDSAGICVYNDHKLPVFKAKGRLSNLSQMVHGGADVPGVIGIGHTRWATHGAPSDANSHPHTAAGGKIVVVHNGIIENYQQLKEMLQHKGKSFSSETDTEGKDDDGIDQGALCAANHAGPCAARAGAVLLAEPGGSVRVDVGRQGSHVQLRVADTGIGIPRLGRTGSASGGPAMVSLVRRWRVS